MARRHIQEEAAEIDMTPMLDVVFIMLIFFIVTTSFVRESGLTVNKPEAANAAQHHGNIMVGVSPLGDVWMQKKKVDMGRVRTLIEQAKAEYPESSVVIVADKEAPSGVVIQVMDQARLAGVQKVSIAADKSQ